MKRNHMWPSTTKWGFFEGSIRIEIFNSLQWTQFLHILMQKSFNISINSYSLLNIDMYGSIAIHFAEIRALKDCSLCANLWVNQKRKCSITLIFVHKFIKKGVCYDFVWYDEHLGRIYQKLKKWPWFVFLPVQLKINFTAKSLIKSCWDTNIDNSSPPTPISLVLWFSYSTDMAQTVHSLYVSIWLNCIELTLMINMIFFLRLLRMTFCLHHNAAPTRQTRNQPASLTETHSSIT